MKNEDVSIAPLNIDNTVVVFTRLPGALLSKYIQQY